LKTLQADQHLRFRADERDDAMYCDMLNHVSLNRILLMTNNPDTFAAFSACYIEVGGRMPLSTPANEHNATCARKAIT
jgi:GTP cyclohydrolase II